MEQEISKRLKRFQDELAAHGVYGALIVQKADLYYFTGTDHRMPSPRKFLDAIMIC